MGTTLVYQQVAGLDMEGCGMNIIEIARQAGMRDDGHRFEFSELKYLEQFAKLVVANIDPKSFMTWHEGFEAGVAQEREECAKVCDEVYESRGDADECATEIRGRSKA
jgi:hypothetical protein